MVAIVACLTLPTSAVAVLATAAFAVTTIEKPSPPTIPVLEVIKVYGKLAGSECFGTKAPKGSSCQITYEDVKTKFGLDDATRSLTSEMFQTKLNEMEFQWPLKPYGVDRSLSKTAIMNKGAETRVYMEELERRGLYNPRNPTGPLPSSLRPQLNQVLQREGIDERVSARIFAILSSADDQLKEEQLQRILQKNMDYYGFLDLIGADSISWPY